MSFGRTIQLIVLAFLACSANAAESRLSGTRSTIEKWVETRQLISRSRSDWQTDKETLEQTVRLLERELSSIEEQMAKLSTNNTQAEKERGQAEALQKASNQSLDRSRQFASDFEGRLANVVARLPAPLKEILKPLLARMPADPATTKTTVTERVQVIVGILNEVDKFNGAANVFSEKRKNQKGEEMAVETIYIGLGAAYFVNDSNDFAGVGLPGSNGWEWTTKSELAPSIREVIRIYRNERPARFVSLPVTIR